MSMTSRQDALVRAMPIVFVLIWSTGFIVARYGMPHSPPMKFLALRYALSVGCFAVWAMAARAAWPVSRSQVSHLAVTGILMHAGYLGGVCNCSETSYHSGPLGSVSAPTLPESAFGISASSHAISRS